jgi:hypothetical protein
MYNDAHETPGRAQFIAKVNVALALALQLEQVIINWGKAMEANKLQ